MVDGIFQEAWDRPVVLRCHKQQPLRCGDLRLEPPNLRSLVRVVILIVKRQITDLELVQREIGWSEPGQSTSQLVVERLAAKTSCENGDLVLAHDGPF